MSASDLPGGSSDPGKPPWPLSSRDPPLSRDPSRDPKRPARSRRHRATRSYVPPVYEHSRTLSTDEHGRLVPPHGAGLHDRNQSASDLYFLQSPQQSPDLSQFPAASFEPILDQPPAARGRAHRRGDSVSKTTRRKRTHRAQHSVSNPSADQPLSVPLDAPIPGPSSYDAQADAQIKADAQAQAHAQAPARAQSQTQVREAGESIHEAVREPADARSLSGTREPAAPRAEQGAPGPLAKTQRGHRRRKSRRKPTILAGTNPMDYGSDQHGLGLGIGISPTSSTSSPYMAQLAGSQPAPMPLQRQQPYVPDLGPYSTQGFGFGMQAHFGAGADAGYAAEIQKRGRGRPYFAAPGTGFSPNMPSSMPPMPNMPNMPAHMPSHMPNVPHLSSSMPSGMASSLPSSLPSSAPSSMPSLPSNMPSNMPSNVPSNVPPPPQAPSMLPGVSASGMPPGVFDSAGAPDQMARPEISEGQLTPHVFGNWTPSIGHSAPPYVPYSQLVQQQQHQHHHQQHHQKQHQPHSQQQQHASTLWPEEADWYGFSPLIPGGPQMHPYELYPPYTLGSHALAGAGAPGPIYGGPPDPEPPHLPGPSVSRSESPSKTPVESYSHSPSGPLAESLPGDQFPYAQPMDPQLLRLEAQEFYDTSYDAAMTVPGNNYGPEAKNRAWSTESVEYLMRLWDAAERHKWKYVSDVLTERQNKRIPLRACRSKFEAMFGETEASSVLRSSLFYVAFRSGWDSIQSVRCANEGDEPVPNDSDEGSGPDQKDPRENTSSQEPETTETATEEAARASQPAQANPKANPQTSPKANPKTDTGPDPHEMEGPANTKALGDGMVPDTAPSTPGMVPDMAPSTPEMAPDMVPDTPDMASDLAPDMASDMAPDLAPDLAPDIAPETRSDVEPGVEPDLASTLAPDLAPVALEPGAGSDRGSEPFGGLASRDAFDPDQPMAHNTLEAADALNPYGYPGPLVRSPVREETHLET